jgi:3,4-dihydroxy 2-butanone 4-phosphate synthase/GTP cyclohydrolase II
MDTISLQRMATTNLPTAAGEFVLHLYHNNVDDKEHMALVSGEVVGRAGVLTRVHSECFTGDVLGSMRCDCGPQLDAAMQLIAAEGRGVVLYMRQEGRGIGLLEKLRAYNLQDMGFDTVDANLMLGHQPDLRDYRVAAAMLKDLGVESVRLLTNNPDKINGLEAEGVDVVERVPLQTAVTDYNAFYLDTKARRMRHLLDLEAPAANGQEDDLPAKARMLDVLLDTARAPRDRPLVTLSYAQSLDGSIAARRGEQTTISGPESLELTHLLRARQDAILVGVGTVLSDDPQLTVRLVPGVDPQPIIVDSRLRFPPTAKMLRAGRPPWIFTTASADPARQAALEAAGAVVTRLPADEQGLVSLAAMLAELHTRAIRRVMVEGGARVISNFLATHLADRLVLTIAPLLLGGLSAVDHLGQVNGRGIPRLANPIMKTFGRDIVLFGELMWE